MWHEERNPTVTSHGDRDVLVMGGGFSVQENSTVKIHSTCTPNGFLHTCTFMQKLIHVRIPKFAEIHVLKSSSSSSSLNFLQAQRKRKSSNPLLTNDYTPIKKESQMNLEAQEACTKL
jgi:hypothetical protein